MMQRNLITNFTIICRKTQDKETIVSLIRALEMRVIMEILNSNRKTFYVLPKNLRSSRETA